MMKQKLFFWLLAAVAVLTACSDDDPTITVLTNDASGTPITEIALGSNKDTRGSVMFQSSDAWEAVALLGDGKECDWLTVSPAQGDAGKVTVTVKTSSSNMTGDPRTAYLTLSAGGKVLQQIAVTQAKMDFIQLDKTEYSITAEGGDVDVLFTASLPDDGQVYLYWSTNAPGWTSSSWIKGTRSLQRIGVRLSVDANQFRSERSAQYQFRVFDKDDKEVLKSEVITLTQPGVGNLTSTDMSRDGEVKQLQKHSQGNLGIPLVIVGDGFVDTQIASGYYDECMKRGVDNFFSEEPYTSLRPYFDVWQVTAVSPTNVLDKEQQTALGSYCTGDGTQIKGSDVDHLKAQSYIKKVDVLAKDLTLYDQTTLLVVMNTDEYAGTCYFGFESEAYPGYYCELAIGYAPMIWGMRHEESRQVMVHENAGHGFAKLCDEYGYADQGTAPQAMRDQLLFFHEMGWMVNVSATDDTELVPWSRLLKDERYKNGDGNGYPLTVLEGGFTYTKGMWKPTEESMMNSNQNGFNAPSREAIYKRVMRMANGSPWEYDYEEFVQFDQAHLPVNAAKTRAMQMERENLRLLDAEAARKLPRFHEPVLVNKELN